MAPQPMARRWSAYGSASTGSRSTGCKQSSTWSTYWNSLPTNGSMPCTSSMTPLTSGRQSGRRRASGICQRRLCSEGDDCRQSPALADWHRERVAVMRQMPGEAVTPLTRLVELPGRGTTRVWECAGPQGAETLVLIHGVTFTAELNWGRLFAPLAQHFRVVAADLPGHGDGIRVGSRFRLEDCADDVATLAGVLGVAKFVAVGYSMGGMG